VRVLGLDASTGVAAVALVGGSGDALAWGPPGPLSAAAAPGGRPAAALLDLLAGLLRSARLGLGALDGLAVAVGPGSYAGVRAAVMTAKALAWAAGLPLAAVDSLEAVAAAPPSPPDPEALVAACLDARRGRVYGAVYRLSPTAPPSPVLPPARWPRPGWIEAVRAQAAVAHTGWWPAGPGWLPEEVTAPGSLAQARGAAAAAAGGSAPAGGEASRAAAVAALGRWRLARGERVDPLRLLPRYLSAPEVGAAAGG
jgi:tRNA threonylcarbamoyladenosine biosynthesis protein TsaB